MDAKLVDKVLQDIDRESQTQREALFEIAKEAASGDPARAAYVSRKATELGLPPSAVEAGYDQLRRADEVAKFLGYDIVNDPNFRQRLFVDGLFGKQVFSSAGELNAMYKAIKSVFGSFAKGFTSDFVGLTLGSLGERLSYYDKKFYELTQPGVKRDPFGHDTVVGAAADYLKLLGERAKGLGESFAPPVNERGIVSDVSAGLGQVLGYAITHARLGAGGTLGAAFLQGAGQIDERLKNVAAEDWQKESAAVAGGAITAATEFPIFKFLFGGKEVPDIIAKAAVRSGLVKSAEEFSRVLSKPFVGTAAKMVSAGAGEGLQEGVENLGHGYVTQLFAGVPYTPDLKEIGYESFVGFLVGALAGGVSDIAHRAYAKNVGLEHTMAANALQAAQNLSSIIETVRDSQIKAVAPDTLASYAQQLVESEGGGSVYISRKDISPELVAQMPELATAQTLNGSDQVEVKIGDLIAKVGGTPVEQYVLRKIRTAPDALSAEEAQAVAKEAEVRLEAELKKVKALFDDYTSRLDEVDQIKQTVARALKDTGLFKSDVADAYAMLHAAFFRSMADLHGGVSPLELFHRYAPAISGGKAAREAAVAAQAQLQGASDAAVKAYIERFGKVVDPDKAKELFAYYNENPTAGAAVVHEGSSLLAKRVFAKLLEDKTLSTVLFTAGGGGSGKSEVLRHINIPEDVAVYDSVLGNFDSAKARIEQALAAGKDVSIVYVNTPVSRALRYAMGRERTVPAIELVKAHLNASRTIKELAQVFGDRIKILVYNTHDGSAPTVGTLEDVPTYDERKVLDDARKQIEAAEESKREALLRGWPEGLAGGRAGQAGGEGGAVREEIPGRLRPVAARDDFTRENIAGILDKSRWAILTAADPNAISLPKAENDRRNAEMVAKLQAAGYEIIPMPGKYGTVADSFAVLDIDRETAVAYGRAYGQESILYEGGLVYMDGRVAPATGVTIYDAEPEDFWTRLPDGTYFTINLDFDNMTAPDPQGVGYAQGAVIHKTVVDETDRARSDQYNHLAFPSRVATAKTKVVEDGVPEVSNAPQELIDGTVEFLTGRLPFVDLNGDLEAIQDRMVRNLIWLAEQLPPDAREAARHWYVGANRMTHTFAEIFGVAPERIATAIAVLSPQKNWYENVSLAERIADAVVNRLDRPFSREMAIVAAERKIHVTTLRGTTLRQLLSEGRYADAAVFVRLYDEAHNARSAYLIDPYGNILNRTYTQKKDGSPSPVLWQSFGNIERAIRALVQPDADLSALLGAAHKVRSFYSNIIAPFSEVPFVTIDTHAVAAAYLLPLVSKSPEVTALMAGTGVGKSSKTGNIGYYWFLSDVYRKAAAEYGVMPREMQSIAWEAVRELFADKRINEKVYAQAYDIWAAQNRGEIDETEARLRIAALSKGALPDWVGTDVRPVYSTFRADILHSGSADAQFAGDIASVEASAGGRGEAGAVDEHRGQASRIDGPLEGLPTKVMVDGREVEFGPFEPARRAAEEYMRRAGLSYNPPRKYVKVDKARAVRIAKAFEAMPHDPRNPAVRAAYEALVRETIAQWNVIKETGLVVEFTPPGVDPYGNPRNAILDVVNNNHLWVFPTDDGFGVSGEDAYFMEDHPLLQIVPGETISGRPVRVNDLFRIVHDYFGHVKEGVGFRADGEENAWRQHWAMFSPLARKALTVETRGQNSWVNFGPYAEFNRTASGADTIYADQKVGLLPDWVVYDGATDDDVGYAQSPVEGPKIGWHFSIVRRAYLDGRYYGTGYRGAEKARVDQASDARIKERVYFYADAGNGIRPESGVGNVPHKIALPTLYDLAADPLKLRRPMASQFDLNGLESRILDAGYHGYYVKQAGQYVGVVLGEASRNIEAQVADYPRPAQYRQAGSESVRGMFYPSKNLIELLPTADLSTFLHESGHFFLETLTNMAAAPDAPEKVRALMADVVKWFGFSNVADYYALDAEGRRPYHEKFAEAFEEYLWEGKAPSPSLIGPFARFRAFLLSVYRTFTRLTRGEAPKLSPDIKRVFDRLLATEDELAATETFYSAKPLWDTKPAGMSDAEWEEYQRVVELARERSAAELTKRSVKGLRWAVRAVGDYVLRLQKEIEGERAKVREEAKAEVLREPIFAAIDAMSKKGGPKLSKAFVEDVLGGDLTYVPKDILARKESDAAPPDAVAEMFGFKSGRAMVRAISQAEPMDSAIEGVTERMMLERYGDLLTPEGVFKAAVEAVHNEARARMYAIEVAAVDKAVPERVVRATAKELAKRLVSSLKIGQIKPFRFAAAAAQAGRAAKSLDNAATARREQLEALYAFDEATKAVAEVQKTVEYFKRFDDKKVRRKIPSEYLEQIDNLLDRFDFRKRTAVDVERMVSLRKWAETQRELGIDPPVPEKLLDDAFRTHYSQITLEDLRALRDTIKAIEHLGRLKNKLLTAKEKRELDEVVDAIATTAIESAPAIKESKLGAPTLFERIASDVKSFLWEHRKLASIAYQLDGLKHGPTWEALIRPMNAAADAEHAMTREMLDKLGEALAPVLRTGGLAERVMIESLGEELSLESRLVVLLNWGNEGNRERLINENGISEQAVNEIAATLTPEQINAVQAIWDTIDSLWPKIAEKEKRLTGAVPEKVLPAPFSVTAKDGSTVALRGGYYPIKYDTTKTDRAYRQEVQEVAKDMLRGAFTRAQTRRGHLEARQQHGIGPVRLDLGVLYDHVRQVVHDLAWHEWLIDATKIVRHKVFRDAVRKTLGHEALRQIDKALPDIAAGDVPLTTAMDKLLSHLRRGVSIAAMGWNIGTAILQPFGLFQSAHRVGAGWLFRGMLETLGSAVRMEGAIAEVQAKSTFMRERAATMNREVREIQRRFALPTWLEKALPHKAAVAVKDSYFRLIYAAQLLVDVPTWRAAYLKELAASGDEARAIAIADQTVRDTQGSGAISDLAAIQRGGQGLQLFTNFYSFFNTTFNLLAERAYAARMSPLGGARLAGDIAVLIVAPAILSEVLHAILKGEDDDELLEAAARAPVAYAMNTVVGLRELSGAVSGFHQYGGPPGTRFFAEAVRLERQIEQGELDKALFRAGLNATGILFHFPAAQVDRTVSGYLALRDGRTDDATALLFGYNERNQ